MLWFLAQSLAIVVLINRYIAGAVLKLLRGSQFDPVVEGYEPTLTVVIPLYNEGAAVIATLESVLAADYPAEKLRVICVDDASTDDSYERACGVAARDERLTVVRNATNIGKRWALISAVRASTSELVVSVDSDVIVAPDAFRQLVRRFTRPEIAAVGGWVDIRNKHDNWLTRMQVVKYWYAYFVMRDLQQVFRRVMVLSGCLTAYRRSVLVELEPILANRSVLGMPVKCGEDRYLTRQIIKAGYLTVLTLDARCRTFVPASLWTYFSQQLRWRRSNWVDFAGGLTHVWKLNPLLSITYFSLLVFMVTYPIGVTVALARGHFFLALAGHLHLVVVMGLYYRWRTRRWSAADRVGALAFIPQCLLMPVTYGLLTPLALFSLDSESWETRG